MYINSDNSDNFFYIEEFDIIDKSKYQTYETALDYKLVDVPNFLELQLIFKKFNLSIFFYQYFFKASFLNFHFKFKFKVKRKLKKNKKKTPDKLLSHFLLKQYMPRSYRLKKYKTKKISPRQPYSYILKSRRFFRRILSTFKLKSYKLTKILLRFFKKQTSNVNNLLHNTLGTLLLKTGFILNLMDSYFFLKTGLVCVNSKPVTDFFWVLHAGDFITLFNPIFFSNYFYYFKYNKLRWLKRKRRRNTFKLRRFITFNANILRVNLVIKRWLSDIKFFITQKSNFEVEYKTNSILVFSSKLIKLPHFFSPLIKPLGVFNTWYYHF